MKQGNSAAWSPAKNLVTLVRNQWFLNQFSSPGFVWQKIQEPLTQHANLLGMVGVKTIDCIGL